MRRLSALVHLLALAVSGFAQSPHLGPALVETILEAYAEPDWYGLYLGGSKIGWLTQELEVEGRPGSGGSLRYHVATEMRLLSGGQSMELSHEETSVYSLRPPYALLRSTSVDTANDSVTRHSVVAGPAGTWTFTSVAGGKTSAFREGGLSYRLTDLLSSDLFFREGPAVGDEFVQRSLDLASRRIRSTTHRVESIEDLVVSGVVTRLYDTLARDDDGTAFSMTSDGTGRTVRGLLGGAVEVRKETEELARRLDAPRDLFAMNLVKLDRATGLRPERLESLELRATGEGAEVFASRPGQEVAPVEGGVRLLVTRFRGEGPLAGWKEREEALRSSAEFPAELPLARSLASRATRNLAGERERLDALVAFTSSYIEDSLLLDSATVAEALERRKGDCSEHARVLVTLARAAGIPARLVSGLYYMGDANRSFGLHAWVEACVEGRWVMVDPVLNQTTIDAAHLAFAPEQGLRGLDIGSRLRLELVEAR